MKPPKKNINEDSSPKIDAEVIDQDATTFERTQDITMLEKTQKMKKKSNQKTMK